MFEAHYCIIICKPLVLWINRTVCFELQISEGHYIETTLELLVINKEIMFDFQIMKNCINNH